MKKRKICVFTGSRADYGPLKPLIEAIAEDPSCQLQLLVSGSHLSPEFGLTYREIETDGFVIDEKVEILLSADTAGAIVKSTALGMIGFSDALERLSPDIIVILGDRFEALGCAYTAFVHHIPVAHISGGELTLGAIDDNIRHAITKFSSLHFVATQPYRKRVIQLGENPKYVHWVGELGLEKLRENLLDKKSFEASTGFVFGKKNILFTYHPETMNESRTREDIRILLELLAENRDFHILFTHSNADTGGRIVNRMIDEFVKQYPERSVVHSSLGRQRYLSALQFMDLVMGNSSSGLIEVPCFHIPTIDIGERQRGRIKAESVISVPMQKEAISDALNLAFSPSFRQSLPQFQNPYRKDDGIARTLSILKEIRLSELRYKGFCDYPFDPEQGACQ